MKRWLTCMVATVLVMQGVAAAADNPFKGLDGDKLDGEIRRVKQKIDRLEGVPRVAGAHEAGQKLLEAGQAKRSIEFFEAVESSQEKDLSRRDRGRVRWLKRLAGQYKGLAETMVSIDGKAMKDGTFEGSARGYRGKVSVTVTVAEGKIVKVEVGRHREDRPRNTEREIPKRIVVQNTPVVDTVSRATVTSIAIQHAAARALEKAVAE